MSVPSQVTETKYPFSEFLSDFWKLITPYRGKFFVGTFFRVTSDLTNLYPTFALAKLVTMLPGLDLSSDLTTIIWLIVGLFVFGIYLEFGRQIAKYMGYQVGENAAQDLKLKGLKHIYSLDLDWQEKENTGNKLKRINMASVGIDRVNRIYFNEIIEATLNSIIIIALFSFISWLLGLLILLFAISYTILGYFLTKKASKQQLVVKKQDETIEGLSFETLNNIKTIKSLGIKSQIGDMMNDSISPIRDKIRKRILLFRGRNAILYTYFQIFFVLIIVIIIYFILQGKYEVALLVLFWGYFQKVEDATYELGEVTHEIIIAKISVHRLKDILNVKPNIETSDPQLDYPKNWKELKVKNISFSYENQKALDNVSFTIKRGERIGIVGISGAGKSTLFKLLMDLYEDYEGEIKLDNTTLKSLDRIKYINNVSVVLQETELFNATLKENILIASTNKSVSEEQVKSSISSAYLDEVVSRLPKGENTIIGEKGIKLSGGEKQRLGIARALYRQPDILLLDEATSHLDVDSEQKIQDSLHNFFGKVTAIVIAHRLSTIKEMDRILVLEKGRIVESGTFDELVNKNGVFSDLWQKQKL